MEQQEPIFEQYLNDGQAYMLMIMPRDLVAECGRGFVLRHSRWKVRAALPSVRP